MSDERVPNEDKVAERAAKLQVDDAEKDLEDPHVAKRAAEAVLEDSEARTREAVDLDPTDSDSVVRRRSDETAVDPH